MVDELRRRAERAGEAMTAARGNAADAMATARDSAADAMATARDSAAEAIAKVKPRLRGVFHEYAFPIAVLAGAALVIAAPGGRARLAAAIYAFSLAALLGTSALYHRVNWRRPEIRRWVRRLDHSMIFLLIAGTVTPFAVLVLDGAFANAILIAVWTGAAVGIVVELIWVEAPKWVSTLLYAVVAHFAAVAIYALPAGA